MAGQSRNSGFVAQAIEQFFTYRTLAIPAVALLILMAVYVALRSNRAYTVGASDTGVKQGQQSLASGTRDSGDFAIGYQDTGTPRGSGQQMGSRYAIQENEEDIDVAAIQEGYSNVTATTASYADWGGEDSGILSAFIGILKKSLPKVRIYHPGDQMVAGAAGA